MSDNTLVGVGLYTLAEASRLTGVSARSIRRWLEGYHYYHGRHEYHQNPVWHKQLPNFDGIVTLGFLDLMEIRFINAFRHHGVSLQYIRLAAARACELFGHKHPFSRKNFLTDGRHVFAEIAKETGEYKLLNLVKSQYAFRDVIRPSLYASIEYSESDELLKWFPMYPKKKVVIDPQLSFGRPIVAQVEVPTDILAKAVEVEGSVEEVSRWYDVPMDAVHAAVEFEQRHVA